MFEQIDPEGADQHELVGPEYVSPLLEELHSRADDMEGNDQDWLQRMQDAFDEYGQLTRRQFEVLEGLQENLERGRYYR